MSSNKIPLFSDTSPGWYFHGEKEPLAVDSSVGINEYTFGRTTPDNKFIVATGLVDQNGVVKMTGAGKSKIVKPKTVKPKILKPKTVKPKTVKPKTVKPKTVKPKVVKPKVVKPKISKLSKKYGGENNVKNIQFSIQICPKCNNISQTGCEMSKGYLYGQYGKCKCPICHHVFDGEFKNIFHK